MGLVRRPTFSLLINGVENRRSDERVTEISVVDQIGFEGDALEIEFVRQDGPIVPEGATLSLALGYEGEPLVKTGEYVAEDFFYTEQTEKVRCISFPSASLREIRNHLFKGKKSLADVVGEICAAAKLKSDVGLAFRTVALTDFRQSNESNLHCLSRLAKTYGATLKAAEGKIVLIKKGSQKSVSGKPLPEFTIKKTEVRPDWQAQFRSREHFGGVVAYYEDSIDAIVGQKKRVKYGKEPYFELKKVFTNRQQSDAAAREKLADMQRTKARFEFAMAGYPRLIAEAIVRPQGFTNKIDDQTWIIEKVTHAMNRSGYLTSVTCTSGIDPEKVGQIPEEESEE